VTLDFAMAKRIRIFIVFSVFFTGFSLPAFAAQVTVYKIGYTSISERLVKDVQHLLLRLGLRKGEALGLRWDEVDLDAEEVTIAHTIKFPEGGGYTLKEPKTEDSVRTIPLLSMELTALRQHRKAQTARRLAAPVWHEADDFVFTTSIGTPIHQRNATRWWHSLLKDADVGQRRMHASRHTCATLLLEDGVPLEVVSAILGHASLSITADIYAKVGKDSMRRALSKHDRLATNLATGEPDAVSTTEGQGL